MEWQKLRRIMMFGFIFLLYTFSNVGTWNKLPKNHDLTPVNYNNDIKTLAWFSNGYYNFINEKDGILRYNDLRYPSFDKENPNNTIFSFTLKKEANRWNIIPFEGKPPSSENLSYLWERIKGK